MNIRKIIGTRVGTIAVHLDTRMKTGIPTTMFLMIMRNRTASGTQMSLTMQMGIVIRMIFPVEVASVRDMVRLSKLLQCRVTRKGTPFFISTAWIVLSRKTTSGKFLPK